MKSSYRAPEGDVFGFVGHRVKEERQKREWSQDALAEASGVSRSTIGRIEDGCEASAENLYAIACAFRVPFGSLFPPVLGAGEEAAAIQLVIRRLKDML